MQFSASSRCVMLVAKASVVELPVAAVCQYSLCRAGALHYCAWNDIMCACRVPHEVYAAIDDDWQSQEKVTTYN